MAVGRRMRRPVKLLAAAAGALALTALLVIVALPAAIDSSLMRARMLAFGEETGLWIH